MAASDAEDLAIAANAVANRWEAKATQFIADLSVLATTVFTPSLADARLPTYFTTRDDDMRTAIDTQPVKPAGMTFISPTSPGTSPTVSIGNAVEVSVPVLGVSAPALDLPVRPVAGTFERPDAPIIGSVSLPSAPTVTLPSAPTLTPVSFPDSPSINLPSFDEAFPDTPDFTIDSTHFDYTEEQVDTPLMDAAGIKLLGDLQNGGYGIDPDDEDSLWERTRDRELIQGQQAEQQVASGFANRGFSMPTGAMHAAIEETRLRSEQAISEANRQISTTRAELFRQSRQFSITQAVTHDGTLLQHAGFRMERALNVSRATVEFSIAVHDAGVRAYNAKVQGYSSFVSAYGSQVQAELAKVQVFSERVRAAAEQQRAQQLDVDLYRALIDASQATVSLYETEVRAVATELDVERIKMELFRTQVDAYATEIRANATEFDAYEAGVRGELAKAQVYNSQVDAYRATVQAAGVESDIRNRNVQVQIERTRAELAGYATEVDAYRSQLLGETERVGALLREYGADTDNYRAALAAWEGLVRVSISEIHSISRQLVNEVQLEQSNARLQLEAAVEGARTRFTASRAGSDLTTAFTTMASESLTRFLATIEET